MTSDLAVDFSRVPSWVFELPPVNASLNGVATVLLATGWILIRSGRKTAHARCMVGALIVSAAFLACYLVYHFQLHHHAGDGSIRFTQEGPVRGIYFFILLTHVVLAIVNVPLIVLTVWAAARGNFTRHRKLARWTWPSWFYVSVTGVIVYFMLYHWFPSEMLEHIPGR
ncbi:MAG TPA: DUF420 domain-containing protein [Verrucomicrobiales bacterium]|nr:DUF420 domain-containing protein [Verrucomicrobiales bacterium]